MEIVVNPEVCTNIIFMVNFFLNMTVRKARTKIRKNGENSLVNMDILFLQECIYQIHTITEYWLYDRM